jgi:hypothetical protein
MGETLVTWKHEARIANQLAVVSGRLNVVKDLKRTDQIVSSGRSPHIIGLYTIPVWLYWPETTVCPEMY